MRRLRAAEIDKGIGLQDFDVPRHQRRALRTSPKLPGAPVDHLAKARAIMRASPAASIQLMNSTAGSARPGMRGTSILAGSASGHHPTPY
ncbi:hypothetical protein GCM10010961_38530 [Pseudodonghicola xiamenensis]|uniref:Uncharacterized protein n=1 Tax=Pseudodonghicola xiamenensis TaxID=337702 RepID=A0A8J3H8T1_9RHOB|nr:hypothetical protein GCM10010961_38530 [Pseudodonghicola xiamenensis]